MNVSNYIDYFRQLAVKHKDLLHNIDSETGDASPLTQHFTKISVEEVLKSLRTKAGFPLLALELYETATEAEIVYDIRQKTKGAFMVVDHPADNNFSSEEACYAKAELIVADILKQMWQDHYGSNVDRCVTPFKDIDFNKILITPVGPIFDNEFGYRVEFEFDFHPGATDFSVAPADGTFGDYVAPEEDVVLTEEGDNLLWD